MPVKVLVQTGELLEDASIGTGHFAFGVRSARLATTAMGLGGMFVLQSAASNLYALRHRIARRHALPRAGAVQRLPPVAAAAGELPPYLLAAAAMQSRAFPAFSYDAAAGDNWADALLAGEQPAGRGRLAGRAAGLRRCRRAAHERGLRLHLRRLHALRSAPGRALRAGAARALECRDGAGRRLAGSGRGARPRNACPTCSRSMARTACSACSSTRG